MKTKSWRDELERGEERHQIDEDERLRSGSTQDLDLRSIEARSAGREWRRGRERSWAM
jgi:hypothetical protein